jgi:hypothetical protein
MMIRARMPRHKLGIGLLGVLASHERGGSGAANLTHEIRSGVPFAGRVGSTGPLTVYY